MFPIVLREGFYTKLWGFNIHSKFSGQNFRVNNHKNAIDKTRYEITFNRKMGIKFLNQTRINSGLVVKKILNMYFANRGTKEGCMNNCDQCSLVRLPS